MAVNVQSLTLYPSDRWIFRLKIHTVNTDIAVNITGATVTFTVKEAPGQPAIIEQSVTNHTNPARGETEIVVLPSDTNIPAGDYIYDFRLEFDADHRWTLQSGKLTVVANTSL